jgi:hypothetical protein
MRIALELKDRAGGLPPKRTRAFPEGPRDPIILQGKSKSKPCRIHRKDSHTPHPNRREASAAHVLSAALACDGRGWRIHGLGAG